MVAHPRPSRSDRQEARDLNKSHAERTGNKLHAETKRLREEVGVLRRQNARIQTTLEAPRLTSQDFQDDLNGVLGEHVAERARLLARINRAVEWGTTWRNNYDRRRDAFNQLLIHFNALEAREYIHSNQTFAAIPDTAPRLDVNSWLREDVPDPRLWGPPGSPVPLFYGYQI